MDRQPETDHVESGTSDGSAANQFAEEKYFDSEWLIGGQNVCEEQKRRLIDRECSNREVQTIANSSIFDRFRAYALGIFGAPGSGKTHAMKAILEAYALTPTVRSLLVLDNKGELIALAQPSNLREILSNKLKGVERSAQYDQFSKILSEQESDAKVVRAWMRIFDEVDTRIWTMGKGHDGLNLTLNPFPLHRFISTHNSASAASNSSSAASSPSATVVDDIIEDKISITILKLLSWDKKAPAPNAAPAAFGGYVQDASEVDHYRSILVSTLRSELTKLRQNPKARAIETFYDLQNALVDQHRKSGFAAHAHRLAFQLSTFANVNQSLLAPVTAWLDASHPIESVSYDSILPVESQSFLHPRRGKRRVLNILVSIETCAGQRAKLGFTNSDTMRAVFFKRIFQVVEHLASETLPADAHHREECEGGTPRIVLAIDEAADDRFPFSRHGNRANLIIETRAALKTLLLRGRSAGVRTIIGAQYASHLHKSILEALSAVCVGYAGQGIKGDEARARKELLKIPPLFRPHLNPPQRSFLIYESETLFSIRFRSLLSKHGSSCWNDVKFLSDWILQWKRKYTYGGGSNLAA